MRRRLPGPWVGLATSLRSMSTAIAWAFEVPIRLSGHGHDTKGIRGRQAKKAKKRYFVISSNSPLPRIELDLLHGGKRRINHHPGGAKVSLPGFRGSR